ncbi:MAG: zf-HC2 domain-containing protein [Gaiellaceae bacterium]
MRACEWVSLRLDSRLSDFEFVLLDAHLAHCVDCRMFARTVTSATEALRSAPLEVPAISFFALPPRRQARLRGLGGGSAAAVAAVAGLVAVVSLQLSPGGTPSAAAHVSRAVIGLKQRQLDQLDAGGRSRARAISAGVSAAKQLTISAISA